MEGLNLLNISTLTLTALKMEIFLKCEMFLEIKGVLLAS